MSLNPPNASELAREFAALPLAELTARARALRDTGFGRLVTYSPKVFIPLTELCRDVCHYCTFAKTPRRIDKPYLLPDDVLEIARAGAAAGCAEALFTLGDKPELRYRAARDALDSLGHETTLDYLGQMARRVREETGLLPHLNPGVLGAADYAALRPVAPSMGIMLESASPRLCERGGPHFGSPDKLPAVRLAAIDAAGQARVPLTTGILIGIGETRAERIESLVALAAAHARHGHIQEIIVQNFVPKPGTKMAAAPAPDAEELLWTVAVARLVMGPAMSIQVPPNLNDARLGALLDAGINDWGGVSPVTPDHVNPESPWPALERLERETRAAGYELAPRLTVYPHYIRHRDEWIDPALHATVMRASDSAGLLRADAWSPGADVAPPFRFAERPARRQDERRGGGLGDIMARATDGEALEEDAIARLFAARGDEFHEVVAAADALRRETCGEEITYVVNRNINYTNVCFYKCTFCAFSKGKASEELRGAPYVLELSETARRTAEAWQRGATEVCLQGGIHPKFTGQTYVDIVHAVKEAAPGIHVHAFSPLEVTHGAASLGISIEEMLRRLKAAGLASLPGTAAEILCEDVRQVICPDKVTAREWLTVMDTAHRVGLRTTSTIMFGHMETPRHWARHLLALRAQQQKSGGFTEFVPLPFVPMEAPMYRRGKARRGPTYREAILMHAVSRLALHPLITNVQASWVKLGRAGAADCLVAGVNDLGGTLMNESISRAAGASHGQEMPPAAMESLAASLGRPVRQRNTFYGHPDPERVRASFDAAPLAALENSPAKAYA